MLWVLPWQECRFDNDLRKHVYRNALSNVETSEMI